MNRPQYESKSQLGSIASQENLKGDYKSAWLQENHLYEKSEVAIVSVQELLN